MSISVLGIYVADLVFFGQKIPVEGETILGNNFVIGPGGKGSNQAVAAAKAGVKTYFISKIGDDQFGEMATKIYDEEVEQNDGSNYLFCNSWRVICNSTNQLWFELLQET